MSCMIICFVLTGCHPQKDEFKPTLPPITQSGENTFGCYVNGNLFIPRDGSGTIPPDKGLRFSGASTGNYNEIRIVDYVDRNGGIMNIHIQDLIENGEGIYTINESNCQWGLDANPNINIMVRWFDHDSQTSKFYCSIENTGVLEISRYDPDNFIVSGTFSCKVINRDDPSEIIEITEGRFDIKWDELPYVNFP